MSAFPQQNGSRNTWGTELRSFFSPYFDLTTGGKGYVSGTRDVTANTSLSSSDRFIFVDATDSEVTITLEELSNLSLGQEVEIQKVDDSENAVVIAVQGADTLVLLGDPTLTMQGETMRLVKRSSLLYQKL